MKSGITGNIRVEFGQFAQTEGEMLVKTGNSFFVFPNV